MEKAEIQALIREAFAAQKFAYVPYSHFHVARRCAAKTDRCSGGCNIENASYTPTNSRRAHGSVQGRQRGCARV